MKNGPNKKAALNLLKLWAEPKIADRWVAYTKNPTGLRGSLQAPASETGVDVYNRYILDMTRDYGHLPMRYFRALTYIFGEKNPVTPNELRANLAEILLGKMTAQEFYDDVMKRFRTQ
jgi:ABC-type glycerol-3-phosphate transport system substrate-binding protein